METINKIEQIARIHANCKVEDGFILVTIPEASNFSAGRAYRITDTGDEIKVDAKRSGDGSGKKTIYIGTVNGEAFEGSIEDMKRLLGIDYRRPKATTPKTAVSKMHTGLMELADMLDTFKAEAEGLDAKKFDEFYSVFDKAKSIASELRKIQKDAEEAEKERREKAEKELKRREADKKKVAEVSDDVIMAEMAKRMNMSFEDFKAMVQGK